MGPNVNASFMLKMTPPEDATEGVARIKAFAKAASCTDVFVAEEDFGAKKKGGREKCIGVFSGN